jgi:hypothetical protein
VAEHNTPRPQPPQHEQQQHQSSSSWRSPLAAQAAAPEDSRSIAAPEEEEEEEEGPFPAGSALAAALPRLEPPLPLPCLAPAQPQHLVLPHQQKEATPRPSRARSPPTRRPTLPPFLAVAEPGLLRAGQDSALALPRRQRQQPRAPMWVGRRQRQALGLAGSPPAPRIRPIPSLRPCPPEQLLLVRPRRRPMRLRSGPLLRRVPPRRPGHRQRRQPRPLPLVGRRLRQHREPPPLVRRRFRLGAGRRRRRPHRVRQRRERRLPPKRPRPRRPFRPPPLG